MFRIRVSPLATLLVLAVGGSRVPVSGQSITGDVVGLVRDTSGAGIPAVNVTLTDEDRNISVNTVTDSEGNYVFARIRPARYSVGVEKQGFAKRTVSGVVLNVSQRVRA